MLSKRLGEPALADSADIDVPAARGGSYRLERFASSGGIFVVLVVFVLIAFALNSRFLDPANVRIIVQTATPIAVIAIGQAFVLFVGEIDLSVGSTVALCAAVLATFMGNNDALLVPVVVVALVLGALVGALNGGLVAFLGIPSFIATLGTLLAVSGGTLVWTQGAPSSDFAPSFDLVAHAGVGPVPVATLIWLVGTAVIAWVLAHKSTWGRRLMLVGSNKTAGHFAGLRVKRTTFWAYVLSGVFAAATAVYVTSYVGSAQTQIGAGRELESIVACVLGGISLFGGRGNVLSVFGAALLLGGLFNFLLLQGVPIQKEVIMGVVVIVAVLAYSKDTGRLARSVATMRRR
ncbi:MAG TPA: ABC transporter permease [Acidimicrobiia bacterium]|nr:ABC transporter permease [Acidimicrobiia bacterium]